jgi:O-antigen ligase
MIREKWAVAGMVIMFLFCMRAIISRKPFVAHPDKVLKSFLLLGIVEIVIAIFQSIRVLPSYNSYFRFTGTFDNPAVLAMIMALCLPISLFYAIRSVEKNKLIWYLLTISIVFCLFLTGSRTCIIAGACTSLIIVFSEYPQFRLYLSNRKVWLPALGGCILLLIALYYYKQDSADGRTLLWIVSLKMIGEKPLFGWGPDGFSASYMPHQATYFLQHPDSRWAYLADNVSNPFNEFLLSGVKYGAIGLSTLSFMIAFLFRMFLRIKDAYKSIYLSILLILFILSMFSYPFMVPMIWLIGVYVVCSVVCIYCMKHSGIRIPIMSLLLAGVLWIVIQNRHIYDEWQWHKLQVSSAPTETIRYNYARLYPSLKANPSFMYNYGAWLHHNGYYGESLEILNECINSLDDYNVELLLADNYRQLGDIEKSIEKFEVANAMVPSRFLPLYHEMITYEGVGDYVNACRIARKIVNKPVKVQRSTSVKRIIREAKEIISSQTK